MLLRTVGDDDRIFPLDGLVGDGFGQVDGEEDRVHLAAGGIKGSLEEDCGGRGKLHGRDVDGIVMLFIGFGCVSFR